MGKIYAINFVGTLLQEKTNCYSIILIDKAGKEDEGLTGKEIKIIIAIESPGRKDEISIKTDLDILDVQGKINKNMPLSKKYGKAFIGETPLKLIQNITPLPVFLQG